MWSVDVMYLLLLCYACLSVGNGDCYDSDVHFVSKNFNNVLHWDPVNSSREEVYSVEYWSDHFRVNKHKYRIKKECQNISSLSCDLTEETPSVDDVYYIAKVMVNGSCIGFTTRFNPFSHTILGPPILATHTTASALLVNITLPLGPNQVSIEEIINSSKNQGSKIEYILNITHPEWAAETFKSKTGQFNILPILKHSHRSYCGHVIYKPTLKWCHVQSESAPFCVKLSVDLRMLLQWTLVSAAVVVGVVIISAVCTCKYLKGGKLKTLPQALKIPSEACKVLQYPDKNLIISEILVGTKNDQTAYTPIQVKPNGCPGVFETYSPQDMPCLTCTCNTDSSLSTGRGTSNLEDTSVQSSETYSAVAVHVQVEDGEKLHQAATEETATSSSSLSSSEGNWDERSSQLPDFDANQLVLNPVWNFSGQLVLPSLSFPFKIIADEPLFQMNKERKPLLSDLIDCQGDSLLMSLQQSDTSDWTDSGCDDSTVNSPTNSYYNTRCSLSQTVVSDLHEECCSTPSSDTASGYKQNWMPELRQPAPINAWISPKTDGEVEDDEDMEDVENSRQIFLGHWGIQTQK